MSEKYFKVIVTKEYIVQAESCSDAIRTFKSHHVHMEADENAYQLTDNDVNKYLGDNHE